MVTLYCWSPLLNNQILKSNNSSQNTNKGLLGIMLLISLSWWEGEGGKCFDTD